VKKLVLIGAALAALSATPAMADDANVLPAGVLRVYVVPTYAWANGFYDSDGKYSNYATGAGKFSLFNLGAAVEYGFTDWISGAVQWVPGITLSSKVDQTAFSVVSSSNINLNSTADVFVGAKLQLVGPKAPVPNTTWLFSVAPGVILPFNTVDADKQTKNFDSNDDVSFDPNRHAFGYGARFYLNYVVSPQFYINLYNESIIFTKATGLKTPAPTLAGGTSTHDQEYGYQLTFELEPNYTIPFGDDYSVSFGLPFDYVTTPDSKTDGVTNSDAGHTYSLGPNASIFLLKTFIPLEFKAQYQTTLAGVNNNALNSFIFQIRAYAKF
jgi:hypothetical protein